MLNKIPPLVSCDPRVSIGSYTYGSPKFLMWSDTDRISIGSFCSIADEVVIIAGGEHNQNWVTTYPLRIGFGNELSNLDGHPKSKGAISIGHDVWIGYGATILSGVSVGSGAIIGARSVVTKNIPSYAVVAGNPAKIIKYRFSKRQIKKLLEINWWEWPIEKIELLQAKLSCNLTDSLLDSLIHGG
jgi:acetyltransferase-like isoleucine patch superfamily enzyme